MRLFISALLLMLLPLSAFAADLRKTRHLGRINDIAFTPDNRWLISGGRDGTIRLWDIADLTLVRDGKR